MKHLLFAALVLGCVLAHISASGEFEFHDEKGNCWRCTPGSSCERCKSSDNKFPINVLPVWPSQCVMPDCEELRRQRIPLSTLFPSVTSRNFYQCRQDTTNPNIWVADERDCPCDTLFSFERQACVWPFEWLPHCSNLNDWETEKCPGEPEDTTTTEATTTTSQSPCTCMPWWPCWCNPCWQMPCHSCSGCLAG